MRISASRISHKIIAICPETQKVRALAKIWEGRVKSFVAILCSAKIEKVKHNMEKKLYTFRQTAANWYVVEAIGISLVDAV
jgi:hypothetical protein